MKKKLFIIPTILLILMSFSCITSKTYCVWRYEVDDLDSSCHIDKVELNLSKDGMSNSDLMHIERFDYFNDGEVYYRLALRHVGTYCNNVLKLELDGKLYELEGTLTDTPTISYKSLSYTNNLTLQRQETHKYILYVYLTEDDIRKIADAEKIRLSYFGQTINMPEWNYEFLDGFVNDVIDNKNTVRKVTQYWIE